ncbi:hypothetical protein VTO42DRAFT_1348 [Malbranchea cinnamomea]
MSRTATLSGWPFQSRTFFQRHEPIGLSQHVAFPPLKRRRFCRSSSTQSSHDVGHRHDDVFTQDLREFHSGLGRKARQKLEDREFFLSLLSSASTKRDARAYLSRFKTKTPPAAPPQNPPEQTRVSNDESDLVQKTGVNLGNIFGPARAVGESPVFRQASTPEVSETFDVPEKLHVALVKLKSPQLLDDRTLHGVARTLSQLNRLGMSCCVVIDTGPIEGDRAAWRAIVTAQANRLCDCIDANHGSESRQLDSVLVLPSTSSTFASVLSRNLLISPLRQGQIVVVVPVAYTQDTMKAVQVNADQAMLTLTNELAGLGFRPDPDADIASTSRKIENLQKEISLDRLIILDPLGGIPSLGGSPHKSHIFVNLEQEYEDIAKELSDGVCSISRKAVERHETGEEHVVSQLGMTNPLSRFVEEELISLRPEQSQSEKSEGERSAQELIGHLNNLKLLKQSLLLLPPSSSALITTPADAANSANAPDNSSQFTTVGTRRRRNPLIHNLLTDKPAFSSSLPAGRLGFRSNSTDSSETQLTHSTFVKKGMPLTLLPDPRVQMWAPGNPGEPLMKLDDPRVDLPRLIHLIEDSFNRKLDVRHYLDRVNKRLAGLIIAGEYEGGAILTWETPPGVPEDGSPQSLSRMVPYLDKFAVLKRSQGAGGVADIVFNAMVRTCFPKGVCWRSRRDNPVNKWYFERSRGSWKLPNSNWTMFWTTDGVPEDQRTFWDYEGVCRTIEPSWADRQKAAD